MKNADQGIDPERFQVVPRTLIFVFDPERRILLIKGAQNKKRWAGFYNGIGGHVEPNEDILDAARRELFEETGIKDAAITLCGQIMISVSNKTGVALFVFKGFVEENDFQSSHEGELQWISNEQINELPLVDDLQFLIPMVLEHKRGDPIFIGKYTFDQNGELKTLFQ